MADWAGVVDRLLPEVLADLADLVAIESVSADPSRVEDVRRSAEAVAALASEAGAADVSIVSAPLGQPAVIARFPGPPGAPTVCLYAHHDVQPEGEPELWTAPPFMAVRRDERLYGRGVADDKGGVALHLATLRAFDGRPPVGVILFVEGEEEIGSPTLAALLREHRKALAADAYVIADSGNWSVGQPAFTTTLRGLVDCVVEVRTLDHAVHSGSYGGVAPDALTALCRLIATLHDEAGNVAVAGLASAAAPDLEYPEDRLRAESGILPGVDYLGEGSVVGRLWSKPSVSVLAIDATPISRASNTLAPGAAAKISLRLAPGDAAARALDALERHLVGNAPWGAQVRVVRGELAEPYAAELAGPFAEAARAAFTEAWGVEPVCIGQGGSIPLAADFAGAYPGATILITAVADPDTRAHGIDESLHLADFRAACLAEVLFLTRCAHIG